MSTSQRSEHTPSVKCRKVLQKMCDMMDLSLDHPSCRGLRKHLEECPDCFAMYDSMKKTIVLYRSYDPRFPARAHKRLMKLLSLVEPERPFEAGKHSPKKPARP